MPLDKPPLGPGPPFFPSFPKFQGNVNMHVDQGTLWADEAGQDIAEYAVMAAVILIIADLFT